MQSEVHFFDYNILIIRRDQILLDTMKNCYDKKNNILKFPNKVHVYIYIYSIVIIVYIFIFLLLLLYVIIYVYRSHS